MIENMHTEFKREYTDNIIKSVIAFANTDGGIIYVGIENDGKIIGVDNIDDTVLRITSSIRDSIRPDISFFTLVDAVKMEDKHIIKIEIARGTARPYYLSSKGISPEGVYVRMGASSVPADIIAIKEMIKESGGYCYEKELSINQDLTFEKTASILQLFDIPFDTTTMRNFGLMNSSDQYTNLGLLLSEQCPHIIKLATFQDEDMSIFLDRKIAEGSVFQQIDTALEYIRKYNRLRAEINGYVRVDSYDYREDIIREALYNSVIHRDYSYDAPIQIRIFSNRIEYVNIGGLSSGVSKEDIMNGISSCRNQKLADIFYRLKWIEAFGTGIGKIMSAYSESMKKPEFSIAPNSFKVVIPNMNTEKEKSLNNSVIKEEKVVYNYASHTEKLKNERMQEVINLFASHDYIVRENVQEVLNVSQATAILVLKEMLMRELIQKNGNGKQTRYVLAERK